MLMRLATGFSLARIMAVSVAAAGLVLIAGCGGKKGPPKLKLYSVKATLSMDGKPYGPAQLTLYPSDPKAPWTQAKADEKGVLKFQTYRMGDGVPAGEFKVALSDFPGNSPVPKIYQSDRTTNLKMKVEPKRNTLAIDMNSKADEIAEAEEMDRQGFEKDKNGKWVPKRKR